MLRNCVLPPRHLLLVCNDPSLSTYDDLHITKHWDKTKQNKQTTELDKVELILEKQFAESVSRKVSAVSSKVEEKAEAQKIETHQKDEEIKLSDDKKDQEPVITEVITVKGEEKSLSTEPVKSTNHKMEDGSDLTHLDVEKCVLTEKNMNIHVIGSKVFDPSIYKESLNEFSYFLKNINLFNKAKIKIDECAQANQNFLTLNSDNDNKFPSTVFSNTNTIDTNFLQRNPNEVCLRKRKGLKRKAIQLEIIY
jgi:hypothetical protein